MVRCVVGVLEGPKQVERTLAGDGAGPTVLNALEPATTVLGLVQLPAGGAVGPFVGLLVGVFVGTRVGRNVGTRVGLRVGRVG